jgi:hypothetical protein
LVAIKKKKKRAHPEISYSTLNKVLNHMKRELHVC